MSANDPKRTWLRTALHSDLPVSKPVEPCCNSCSEGAMRRREFISGLCATVAMPLAAGAQQQSTPLVGILGSASPTPFLSPALLQGLNEAGYAEGQHVRVEQ